MGGALALAGGCSGKTKSSPGEGDGGSNAVTDGSGGASNTTGTNSTPSASTAANGGTAGGTDAVGGTNASGGTGAIGGTDAVGGTNASGGTGAGATGGANSEGSYVGRSCAGDGGCRAGLECVVSSSDLLGGGGPAHGLCTRRCGVPGELDDDICQALDPKSRCVTVAGGDAYCLPRCGVGASGAQCQDREDLACDIAAQICRPKCSSHSDCTVGRYCDPRSGLCVDDEPAGLSFDEPCDPAAEVDPCLGYCSDEGICVETCVLGNYPSCGSTSTTEATADCLYLLYGDGDVGDLGACGRLCDCESDCLGDTSCLQLMNQDGPFEFRGRAGICGVATSNDVTLPCGAAGAGGSP